MQCCLKVHLTKYALAFTLIMLVSGHVSAQSITFLTEHVPSRSYIEEKDHTVTGWASEAVREISKLSDISSSTILAPWARSYRLVLDNPDACIFLITRTPDRENLFQWVGPMMMTDWTFFAVASSGITAHSLADIRHLTIGVYRNDVRHEYLQSLGGYNLVVMPERDLGPDLLRAGRIDLWFDSYDGVDHFNPPDRRHQITPVLTLDRPSLWVGCNRRMDKTLVLRMNKAAEKIRNNGYLAQLREEFEGRNAVTQ